MVVSEAGFTLGENITPIQREFQLSRAPGAQVRADYLEHRKDAAVAGLQHHCLWPRMQCKYVTKRQSLSQRVSRASTAQFMCCDFKLWKKALRCCRHLDCHFIGWQMLQLLWQWSGQRERESWDSCCNVRWGYVRSVQLLQEIDRKKVVGAF